MTKAVIAIHGGAGAISKSVITPEEEKRYKDALTEITAAGADILNKGGTALDAVTLAVQMLEDNPLFNAGKGAVFTSQATHELDASIMDGSNLKCGSIAGVKHIKNPIKAARAVMEKSKHVFFIGEGAEAFAKLNQIDMVDADYFSTDFRREQLNRVLAQQSDSVLLDHDAQALTQRPLDEDKKMGTVGAVAIDIHGNLAAATSTGGMTNKTVGRVGDSPIIGAGCYANNKTCAISSTGHGEMFIRAVVAYDVSALMEYAGLSLQQACDKVVFEKLPALNGSGGIIAVDKEGNVYLPFNSEGMYRGYAYAGEKPIVSIYKD